MDRRYAIKNIASILGCTIATPTILSVLSSCKNNSTDLWKPVFLNEEEKHVIDYLVDIILPESDTPGGMDLNLTQFIDKMLANTIDDEAQNEFHNASKVFASKVETVYDNNVFKVSKDEVSKLVETYFNIDDTKRARIFKLQELSVKDVLENQKEDYYIYKFLIIVRELSLLGYFTSQTIMEDVQGYVPTYGYYEGCVDLNS